MGPLIAAFRPGARQEWRELWVGSWMGRVVICIIAVQRDRPIWCFSSNLRPISLVEELLASSSGLKELTASARRERLHAA